MHRFNMAHRKAAGQVFPAALESKTPVVAFTAARCGTFLEPHDKWSGEPPSAGEWRVPLEPVVARYRQRELKRFLRADAAFARPDVYEFLEAEGYCYTIRLPANNVLERHIEHLLRRPVGRPPSKPIVWYHSFSYRAATCLKSRRGQSGMTSRRLFARVGFIVTNLTRWSNKVVHFYNERGTAAQRIKEEKQALHWTRLSCHDFVDNQVRVQLFALAYNLANFLRRLALPKRVSHWSLTTLREKLIKIGAKVVKHARYATLQLADVGVPRGLFAAILARIGRLQPVPGSG